MPLCLLPLKPQTQIHTLTLHILHTSASVRPGASATNKGYRTPASAYTHTHTNLCLSLLCFHPAVLSMASHSPEQHVHHCVCALILSAGHSLYMSQAANHSINPGFITLIVMSRPPALSFQDVKEQGERILLIQLSDHIFFKSKFLLHLLRRSSLSRGANVLSDEAEFFFLFLHLHCVCIHLLRGD